MKTLSTAAIALIAGIIASSAIFGTGTTAIVPETTQNAAEKTTAVSAEVQTFAAETAAVEPEVMETETWKYREAVETETTSQKQTETDVQAETSTEPLTEAAVQTSSAYTFTESTELNSYESIEYYSETCCVCKIDGKYGLLDNSGTLRVKPVYDAFRVCSCDAYHSVKHYYAEFNGSEFMVDAENILITCERHGESDAKNCFVYNPNTECVYIETGAGEYLDVIPGDFEGLNACRNIETGKWGIFNEDGEIVVNTVYDNIGDFSNGYALMCKNGKCGYIDSTLGMIIPMEYDETCRAFDGNCAAVEKDGKMGVIDSQNSIVVPFEYDMLMQGENGTYIAQKDGVWGTLEIA